MAANRDSPFKNVNNADINARSEHLKIYYTNCDCLTQSKLMELKVFVDQCNPDIIAITELYPKNYIFSPDSVHYNIDGYDLYMSDSSSGRGVGIYTKTCLNATILNFDTTYKDQIWCQVNY